MEVKGKSLDELFKLKHVIEKEIVSRQKLQRREVLAEIKAIAAKHGFDLADIVNRASANTKSSRLSKGLSVKAKVITKTKSLRPLYRHPENRKLTWGGGRGRRPQWVKDWEASGRSLEELVS